MNYLCGVFLIFLGLTLMVGKTRAKTEAPSAESASEADTKFCPIQEMIAASKQGSGRGSMDGRTIDCVLDDLTVIAFKSKKLGEDIWLHGTSKDLNAELSKSRWRVRGRVIHSNYSLSLHDVTLSREPAAQPSGPEGGGR